jgi:two-component system, OmpR family, sensor histidine kinase MprB
MTLRARIAAVAGLAVAVAVLAAAGGIYVAVRSELRKEVDVSLTQRARVFVAGPLRGGERPGFPRVLPPGGARPSPDRSGPGAFPDTVQPVPLGGASGYVQFVSPDGVAHVPGGQGPPASIPVIALDTAVARRGSGLALTDRKVKGTRLRVLTFGAGGRGAVLIARPLTEVDKELGRILLILAIVGACGIALAAALGALVARAALAPIARFTQRTETLAGNLDPSRRLPAGGKDELGRLATSFNATLDALERSVQAQRNLVADASHELRTPIASIRANIQTLADAGQLPAEDQASLRADIVGELDELTKLVGDVVELARSGDTTDTGAEVHLEEIVKDAVERARRRSDLQFEVELDPTLVKGDAKRIDHAVSNLLDNALKWSPPGKTVDVDLHDGVLTVRDRGPGFEEADLPHVFERFHRADSARKLPGSGLGLAIVRQAAEAHQGYATASNAPGGGALLRVSFGPPVDRGV